MAREAFVLGSFSSEFRKWPGKSFKDLTRDACLGVLHDAGTDSGKNVDSVWFGNSGMGAWGQTSIRGQVCLAPLIRERLLPERVPVMNVENACATGTSAFCGAWKDVMSGQADLALAVAAEKLHFPGVDKQQVLEGFSAGVDNFDRDAWLREYEQAAAGVGGFHPEQGRTVFVDTCAVRARAHMMRYGTKLEHLATVCSKSHWYGARNRKAQYGFELGVAHILGDKVVSDPLTRAMCASPGDGAAAVLVCSGEYLSRLPARQKSRAVRVAGTAMGGGVSRSLDEPGLTYDIARTAYRRAGILPQDVHVAEVHDSTAFCEISETEMLGFCEPGQGGPFAASGATSPGGRIPVNTSGGLVSKSHPVGATGLAMIDEVVTQLRGEAGERQVRDARVGLVQNAGGAVGLGDAVCSVVILEGGSTR
jgi:acetyl-CoA acetyltransferase